MIFTFGSTGGAGSVPATCVGTDALGTCHNFKGGTVVVVVVVVGKLVIGADAGAVIVDGDDDGGGAAESVSSRAGLRAS